MRIVQIIVQMMIYNQSRIWNGHMIPSFPAKHNKLSERLGLDWEWSPVVTFHGDLIVRLCVNGDTTGVQFIVKGSTSTLLNLAVIVSLTDLYQN